jgi:hypothetical protein
MHSILSRSAAADFGWLTHVEETTTSLLERLQAPEQPGRFLPCERGATELGRAMGLGFSCFALRTLAMFGRWESRPYTERRAWLDYIRSFQVAGEQGAFIDPPEINYLSRSVGWGERIVRALRRAPARPSAQSIILAESKQAIATLAEIGESADRPFTGFPTTPKSLGAWLQSLDWTRPWGAGGQSATMVVFLKTQAPKFLEPGLVTDLLNVCREFFATIADPVTGAYFRGKRPRQGELINGAMKVLMSLDWLEVEPHYREKLVATCLRRLPSASGCHLVDAIYVLHQCVRGAAERDVRDYCLRVLEMVKTHSYPWGGFSFYLRKAQTSYYGVPITHGLDEPDLQGTCLLVWALAMIWRIVDPERARWSVVRP